jgi:hypothetical protein
MVRGRRCVGGMGAGRRGGAGVLSLVSCSHRAQGGLCVRPANGVGALERLRLAFAGTAGVVRPGSDQVTCNITKSHRMAHRASW